MDDVTRKVLVVGHPGVLGMELLGARDVLEIANSWRAEQHRPPAYSVAVTSLDGAPLRLWGGLTLDGTVSLADHTGPLDTLVVVGGPHAEEVAATDHALVDAISAAAARARRVVSLCTGAFLLAAAGVLSGRRATTHWMAGSRLAESHPDVGVDTDAIYVRDGETWTSAGITASHDLMLALVEDDLGVQAARAAARILVVFLRRAGGQSQFSVQLTHQLAQRHPLRELQQYIADHPDADLSLARLAESVHMSPRHFARVFRAEVGVSPGCYVERTRLETARRWIEESDLPLARIAAGTGFGTGENLRRAFVAALGASPAEYRRRFGRPGPQHTGPQHTGPQHTGPQHTTVIDKERTA